MTGRQLWTRVQYWQKVMAPLGVGHWDVTVEIVDQPHGKESASAAVWCSGSYDTCKMEFASAAVETADPDEMDRTIIHEWLHVADRDFQAAIEWAEDGFSPAVSASWAERVDHEREGYIERLSRLIHTLHG